MNGLESISQMRLHILVDITSWQPCCLQSGEACHLLRVLFGDSDLQSDNDMSSFAHSLTVPHVRQSKHFALQHMLE